MRKAISEQVSVGEQPRQSDLEQLKKDGVTTVVNLRMSGEDSPLTPDEEHALAEKLDLEYYHVPISLDKLDVNQVRELRRILQNSQGPTFVHCGTGARACSFSLAASGADADSIFQKARELGFPVQDERMKAFLKSLHD